MGGVSALIFLFLCNVLHISLSLLVLVRSLMDVMALSDGNIDDRHERRHGGMEVRTSYNETG